MFGWSCNPLRYGGKKMKKLIAILLVLVMTMGLCACGQQVAVQTEPTEPTPPPTMAAYEPNPKTIHVLVPEASEGWEAEVAAAATAKAEELAGAGVAVSVQTYADDAAQAKLMEEIAAAGPNDGSVGVVLMPAGEAAEAALQKLLEANVSYALAETIPESAAGASVANVYYDHRQIGAAAAAYLVNAGLTQKNDVVVLEGLSDADALKTEGFQLYLQGKLQVNGAAIETPWDDFSTIAYSDMEETTRDGAKTYFETYMEDGDRAWTGYFASWDDDYFLGMLDALNDGHITKRNRNRLFDMEPVVAGFGASAELRTLLEAQQAEEEEEQEEEVLYVEDFRSINSIVYDPGMLAQALQAMADHMADTVVEQDQPLSVQWMMELPVEEEATEE